MSFTPDYDVPEERKPYTLYAKQELGSGRIGCLMLHGFMGSPGSSRPMAEYLSANGITMHCPLLPGHGHYPDKLYEVSHQSWLTEAEEGLERLRQLCDEVFIIGHSMGTIMGAYLATKYDQIRGMVMLTPLYAIPDQSFRIMRYLRHVVPWIYPHKIKIRKLQELVRQRVLDFDPTFDFNDPADLARLPQMSRLPTSGLDEMVRMVKLGRQFWSQLTLPILIFQGGDDPAVSPATMRIIYELLPSKQKQLKTFPEAGHELMRPFEPVHTKVWQLIHRFFLEHSQLAMNEPT
jgi:carboxylesterase